MMGQRACSRLSAVLEHMNSDRGALAGTDVLYSTLALTQHWGQAHWSMECEPLDTVFNVERLASRDRY
jgi:hypothetical protein